MRGENRVEPGWPGVSDPRRHNQTARVESWDRGHERTCHGHSRFADGEHVGGERRRVGEDAPGECPVQEQAGIGPGDRGGDDVPEIGAKPGERNRQWAFAGSDQADNPVSTSISRRRRLTTCSPFCCAQS